MLSFAALLEKEEKMSNERCPDQYN